LSYNCCTAVFAFVFDSPTSGAFDLKPNVL
jgi:hypothetical protein